MYLLIQAHEYGKHKALLGQSFKLRKRVFSDQLRWQVNVEGDVEKDLYDDLRPAYLVWCDDTGTQLYGTVRLLPTTGPTLLYDVFRDTFPHSTDLVAPSIWEGTRMCIDENALEVDFPEIRPDRAFCLLLLALCEVALESGIATLISNFEPHMRRIYLRSGAEFDELGRADGYGRKPVCCGAFEVSQRVLDTMRAKLGVTKPLYQRRVHPSPIRPIEGSQSRPARHYDAPTFGGYSR